MSNPTPPDPAPRPSTSSGRPDPVEGRIPNPDAGFTLVEVLVAAALLIVAASGIAQLLALGLNATDMGRATTTTSTIAGQKMEQLRSLAWAYDEGGAPRSDTYTDLSREPPASGGRGLDPSPSGTLDRNVAGYVEYLDARGRGGGGGPPPPPGGGVGGRGGREAAGGGLVGAGGEVV